jgi:enoyl-CoA hydratase/carnithine racemase
MNLGPIKIIRSNRIANYKYLGSLFEWVDGHAYLMIDKVAFRQIVGAILCYHNPPIHEIGTMGLYAYQDGLDAIIQKRDELAFLILSGANAPVHSGGDLKESLESLKKALESKREMEANGASAEEIDRLFGWGKSRLEKGVTLWEKISRIAQSMRTVGICGGGLRFGGSAEIPLMADYLIGDSRSGMCFSESMIGIIPGWGGITRVLLKSGLTNAEYMAKTAKPALAPELKAICIYNDVVEVPFNLPKMQKTGDPDSDKKRYMEALEEHDEKTGVILLPAGLEWATFDAKERPTVSEGERETLAEPEEIVLEVSRRADPFNYSHLWGKRLKDVKDEIARLGRPLAPQSIDAIDQLLGTYDASTFDEAQFIHQELQADAALYRDSRFMEGLSALLDQRVPDFRSQENP